jgi:hypothetical protein
VGFEQASRCETDQRRGKILTYSVTPELFPASDHCSIRFQLCSAVLSFRGDDGPGRYQTGFNRWQDPLATLRVCQAGGIADQQKAFTNDATLRRTAK